MTAHAGGNGLTRASNCFHVLYKLETRSFHDDCSVLIIKMCVMVLLILTKDLVNKGDNESCFVGQMMPTTEIRLKCHNANNCFQAAL